MSPLERYARTAVRIIARREYKRLRGAYTFAQVYSDVVGMRAEFERMARTEIDAGARPINIPRKIAKKFYN